jgi:hypothetical protein
MRGEMKLKVVHNGLQPGGGVEMQSVKSGGWDSSCPAGTQDPLAMLQNA